jgi:acetyl-CoA carboxylase biotin carboxyl carrier protein
LNFKEILELIDKVAERGIAGVEIEQAGTKVRIEGKPSKPQVIHSYVGEMKGEGQSAAIPLTAMPAPQLSAAASSAAPAKVDDTAGLHIITSPIVGTFYRAANPEAENFVNVGDRIVKGKVLCIVEAMKLMNEIESDVEGVITQIYPSNGQPIEYGEKLFAVKI